MIRLLYKFLMTTIRYCVTKPVYKIKRGYKHRTMAAHFDDINNQDEWQKEVYADAKYFAEENHYHSILDIGCGSGYKLVHYFGNYAITGVEIEPTLSNLMALYPQYQWKELNATFGQSFDIIICSDVIEHVESPDFFLEQISKSIVFNTIIISTPERDLIKGKNDYGPPKNLSHYREWNQKEFHAFISDYFLVTKHYISNKEQGTQVIYAQKK